MVVKTARILSPFVAMLILFAGLRPAVCQAWSILHPLTFSTTPKPPPKPPSTLDKIVAAPVNLVTSVGNTITGKTPPAPKTTTTLFARVSQPTPPKPASSSWVPAFLQPQPPAKPKSVSDWLSKPRVQ
jgi:hypothetical protein